MEDRAIVFEKRLERSFFALPGGRPRTGDYCNLGGDDGCVFDKIGIGERRFGRQGDHIQAQAQEGLPVELMLVQNKRKIRLTQSDGGQAICTVFTR